MYKYTLYKSAPDAPKLYALQENNSASVFYSLSSVLYFIGDKIYDDSFKYEIKPSLKENDRLKSFQDVALNHVIEKGKPR